MPTSPTLVLFDLDDVLCHYDRSARIACMALASGRDPEAVYKAIWESGLEARADAGLLSETEYLSEMGERLGCRVTLETWLTARKAAMTPQHEVLALAKRLAEHRRVAVLTNNCRLVAEHICHLCPAVFEIFGQAVYSSAEFGAAKPASQAFLRCASKLGVAPAEVLFVDDLSANVAGAINAGFLGHHFVSTKALAQALQHHQLL
ncbi:HAD family phosphatase [Crenobacter sp. SG2305]|uniref:HAD family hydrolase n=1 Tax=Crenobacter oryzisoli TaxID=3056844 RepID=UPI0025AB1D66|nr:HAD family phosphatase [Crenobacter sp. SG2305]MDN0082026.1 HAD family phosphatase [Crenobacter sp. SG2305]